MTHSSGGHERPSTHVAGSWRDSAGPRPVGETPACAVFVSNQGDGTRETDQESGLGAMALASALAQREAAGAKPPPTLLTLRERSEKYPQGAYGVE